MDTENQRVYSVIQDNPDTSWTAKDPKYWQVILDPRVPTGIGTYPQTSVVMTP